VQTNPHQTGRAHCDGAPVHYERHRPEQTTLYRLVQQHAQSFIAQSEEATGARLPQFVRDEFDAFLECGILAHGFLRLRCGACGHDKLLAFSCKRRGFCPSCGARRMSQTGHNRALAADRFGASQLMSWVGLLKRVFNIDMRHCPNCGAGELKIIAATLERPAIQKILDYLGLGPQPPPKGRTREARHDCTA
jgi:hypothetical protein